MRDYYSIRYVYGSIVKKNYQHIGWLKIKDKFAITDNTRPYLQIFWRYVLTRYFQLIYSFSLFKKRVFPNTRFYLLKFHKIIA
jgi:hypothetical protein